MKQLISFMVLILLNLACSSDDDTSNNTSAGSEAGSTSAGSEAGSTSAGSEAGSMNQSSLAEIMITIKDESTSVASGSPGVDIQSIAILCNENEVEHSVSVVYAMGADVCNVNNQYGDNCVCSEGNRLTPNGLLDRLCVECIEGCSEADFINGKDIYAYSVGVNGEVQYKFDRFEKTGNCVIQITEVDYSLISYNQSYQSTFEDNLKWNEEGSEIFSVLLYTSFSAELPERSYSRSDMEVVNQDGLNIYTLPLQ